MSNLAKIDLSAIMNNNNADKSTEKIEKHSTSPDTQIGEYTNPILENNASEAESISENKIEIKIENNIKNKTNKIQLKNNSVDDKDFTKSENNENDSLSHKIKINKDLISGSDIDEGDIFSNYKSDFSHKKNKIIEKVEEKNKKVRDNYKKSGTRLTLVFSLIAITAISISALFILDPEKHSLSNYKTSILNNTNNLKVKYIDKPWVSEVIKIKSYSFNIQTQKGKNNSINYKYKSEIYESKDELYKILNNKIQLREEKTIVITEKEAIKNALINKFK